MGLVGGLGYYFTKYKNQTTNQKNLTSIANSIPANKKVPSNQKPVSKNIYDSRMQEAADNYVLGLSQQNYNKSAIPSITGVLPPIYNSYSIVGADSSLNINEPNSLQLSQLDSINKRADINTVKQPAVPNRPMFAPILNLQQLNYKEEFSNFDNNVPTKQDISLLTDMPIDMSHTNQVPFFGSNVTQNMQPSTNETLLDTYTGNSKLFFHKQEQFPKFALNPQAGVDANMKTPPVRDYIDNSRFIPSRFKQGEKPFAPQLDPAPIAFTLDNPVTTAQITEPTIDQLRVATKPQISYKGMVKAGKSLRNKPGIIGYVSKYGPETSFKWGENRLFTAPAAHRKPMMNPEYSVGICATKVNVNNQYYGIPFKGVGTIQRSVIDNCDELINKVSK